MTLSEIIYECGELGVKSIRVNSDWKRFVNRAMRQIANRRNWSFMHDQRTATIVAPSLSVSLGKTFKQLSSEKSPVSYQDPSTPNQFPIPVEVISRARADRMGYNPAITPFPSQLNAFPLRYVFIERNMSANEWQMFLPQQYQTYPTVTFNISAYYYPDDLDLGDDRNGLTDHGDLCEALINLTKALAYLAEEVDDPKGKAAYELYELAMKHAFYNDSSQVYGGRSLKL